MCGCRLQVFDFVLLNFELKCLNNFLLCTGKVTLYDEATMVELRPSLEKIGGKLESLSPGSVAARLNVHAVLKKMLLRAMSLINLDTEKNENYLFEELQKSQSRISVSTFASIFESAVQIAQGRNTGNFPTVSANRGTVPAEQRKKDKTVFYQIFKQVKYPCFASYHL